MPLLVACPAAAQTVVQPGFNVFTVDQDVEIGRQSALQVEKQIPTLSDPAIQSYVASLGARLAARAPGPRFAYHFKVVNLSDVNAFALPGGYVYVHRGLLEQVRTEGELAGVLAHEIAHVALRHPTNQASKAYLAQAGLGLLGGLLDGRSSSRRVVGALGGFGLNTLFLKFSRTMETQADVVGTQIMHRAGYDPMEMAHFFDALSRQAGGNPGRFAVFLSNHPAPADREARVRREALMLGRPTPMAQIGGLAAVQSRSHRYPPAPSLAQLAQGQTAPAGAASARGEGLSIERPSSTFRVVQQPQGLFRIERPDNWTVHVSTRDYGVTIVPRGGIIASTDGHQHVTHGVIINHYVPFEGSIGSSDGGGQGSLEAATDDLVLHIEESNPSLRRVAGSESRRSIGGRPGLAVDLAGRAPGDGTEEQIQVVTEELPDGHVLYVLLVAPRDEFTALGPTFDRMLASFQTDVRAMHH
ncbi:MAG: hypothetical protein E6K80_04215 [Candidatus Eisenbacteria bacterium]|uniref:Peptidase M48 domain-containing protein n=1 Tax=Eiseniibacteriota bacterium TaxID=2212470 RepID=A0A538U7M3_UNCEI|nr:MAG: hypothetical protein E6K80_04215 [Candidatus Eisenbacteria bacterium]